MSQRDLVAELRAARIEAPSEVRARIREIAADDTTRYARRFTWRRALVVALPVAAAIAASIVFTRPDANRSATRTAPEATRAAGSTVQHGATTKTFQASPHPFGATADSAGSGGAAKLAVPAAAGRVQQYGAFLALRLESAVAVSDAVKSALRITSSLGGYPTSVHASSQAKDASADLILKIPRTHVQQAISRLSALGTITSEQVDVQDKQAGLNATDRTIARLQAQLKQLRAQPPSAANTARLTALTARIARLQRAEAATRRTAHYATIQLHLTNAVATVPHKAGHGPLHGVVVALTWLGIGAVYALAIGAPLVVLGLLVWLAARLVRRRREDALLNS